MKVSVWNVAAITRNLSARTTDSFAKGAVRFFAYFFFYFFSFFGFFGEGSQGRFAETVT